ncbi:SLBB domain-containing protein [Oscillatoria acuminata]|uniref:Periplasmic protein involved in polysaccharide export n=1 Tax=Oscillatoria acuminata PCC 6304 TaxID=56110 RepID=K9TGP9_9CYAN|nr:SLBB domain-containing protein [Oscillatoria acuminata]AFY81578.1 periplasmic protein involved in polysaccharide export [Oscillatoria acuminata PCC 6304]
MIESSSVRQFYHLTALTLAGLHTGATVMPLAAVLTLAFNTGISPALSAPTPPELAQGIPNPLDPSLPSIQPGPPVPPPPGQFPPPTPTSNPQLSQFCQPRQGLPSPNPQQAIAPQTLTPSPIPPQAPPPIPTAPPAPAVSEPNPFLETPDIIPVSQFPTESYQLAPGDQIVIDVQPYQNISIQTTVSPQGQIVMQLLGPIEISGLTPQQAQQRIQSGLNEFLVDPQVNVALIAKRGVNITVTGEVTQPGFYFFAADNTRISDILTTVGGTTPGADLTSILIRRPLGDGRFLQQRLNLLVSLQAGSPPPDLLLQEGDILIVPKQTLSEAQINDSNIVARSRLSPPQAVGIRVIGEVTRPGFYNLPPSVNPIQDALVIAGGSTPAADLRSVRVRRVLTDGRLSEETIDLYSPLQTSTPFPELRLGNGDIIIVPTLDLNDAAFNYNNNVVSNSTLTTPQPVGITIVGEVTQPGFYILPASPRPIPTALQIAGGTTPVADLRGVRVRRTLPDGRVSEESINLLSSLQGSTPFSDLRLANGDVLIIPKLGLEEARTYDSNAVSTSTLAAQQSVAITVLGEVVAPGFHVLPPSLSPIPTALQAAGGITTAADLRTVLICRVMANGTVSEERVNLYAALETGTPLPDLRLGNGDVVIVPKLGLNQDPGYNPRIVAGSTLAAAIPVNVTILGEVAQPGFFTVPPSDRPVADAMLVAGGITSNADLRAVRVRRALDNGSISEEVLDLYTPLLTGAALPELRLANGDVVFVPTLESSTDEYYDRVLVSRSTLSVPQIVVRVLSYPAGGISVVPVPSGSTFADILNAVPILSADLNNIALIRFDPEQGKAVTREINAQQLLRGDLAQNVPLENNDVIVIGRNLVGKITYALGTFTQPFRDVLGFLLFFDSLRDSARLLFGPDGNNDENNTNN